MASRLARVVRRIEPLQQVVAAQRDDADRAVRLHREIQPRQARRRWCRRKRPRRAPPSRRAERSSAACSCAGSAAAAGRPRPAVIELPRIVTTLRRGRASAGAAASEAIPAISARRMKNRSGDRAILRPYVGENDRHPTRSAEKEHVRRLQARRSARARRRLADPALGRRSGGDPARRRLQRRARRAGGGRRAVRLRQVDPDRHRRGPGAAQQGQGAAPRQGAVAARRGRPGSLAARARLPGLPGLPSAAQHDRRGERRRAAGDRRRAEGAPRRRASGWTASGSRDRLHPLSAPAFRRRAAAGGAGAGARRAARAALRRRADRQPRRGQRRPCRRPDLRARRRDRGGAGAGHPRRGAWPPAPTAWSGWPAGRIEA